MSEEAMNIQAQLEWWMREAKDWERRAKASESKEMSIIELKAYVDEAARRAQSMSEEQKAAFEKEIEDLKTIADRTAAELDQLWHKVAASPICGLQFPDGSVAGNIFESAEGWKRWYERARDAGERLAAQLSGSKPQAVSE